jgi:enoyl-CoA hydratase
METPGPDPESILVPPETTVIEVEPPTSLVEYTETVERLCKQLDRDKSTKVVLCIRGGPLVVPVCTAAALQRYELALAKLQKRSLLLVAALDGALCDLSLSLALACDFRLATADTCLPARPASQATGATQPYVPLPIWWLASLALHAGVLRAQKLLWRTQPAGTHELLDCHVVHALCPTVAALRAARLPVPPNVPLALLRRIVLQTFSVAGTDVIGHSLAVSSLVIADAVGRAAAAHAPLPPLVPLEYEVHRSEEAWVLTMPSELELISLDELSKVLEQLNRGLAALAATGEPLPTCLVLRMLASERAARLPMPQQLLALHAVGGANGHFNMRLVSWLTKLEKALASLNTLPLPTVCVLVGTGSVGATALQIAFACDLRAAAPSVTLDFGAASGTLPGTLAFRLAKHVGAGVAMALMAQDSPLGTTEALRVGALQWIVAPKAAAADAPAAEVGAWLGALLARAAHGASLLLCRYLLQDTIWMARPEELRAMLKVWHTAPAAATSGADAGEGGGEGGGDVVEAAPPLNAFSSKISSAQLEQLASFFPDQFIMPTEAWQWKLEWARAGARAAQGAAAETTEAGTADAGGAPLNVRVSTEPLGSLGCVVRLRLTGSVLTAEALGALTEALTTLEAAEMAKLEHGTSAQMMLGPSAMGAGAPPPPPPLGPTLGVLLDLDEESGHLLRLDNTCASREAFTTALDALDALTAQVPTTALMRGELGALALELCLACKHRLAASAAVCVRLAGWQAKMVPGARVWQLGRSARIGSLLRVLLATPAADLESLVQWGVLEAPPCEDEADVMARLERLATQVDAPGALSRVLARREVAPPSPTLTSRTPSAGDDATVTAGSPSAARASTVSGEAMASAAAELSDKALLVGGGMLTEPARRPFASAAWLREVAGLTELAELRRRTEWLLVRLPQLEPESALPLLQQHLNALIVPASEAALPRALEEDSRYVTPDALGTHSLQLLRQGALAIVTINRPSYANAYDGPMLDALERLIPMLSAQRCGCVIFKSSDPRFFCSGADLERVSNPRAMDALELQSQRVFESLAKAPFVSIAVVEGAAVAGGFEWALACDVRLVGPGARFWLPETSLGLVPAAGGCTRLTEAVGAARAKQVILFHERLSANSALEWGLALSLSPTPLTAALELAAKLGTDQALARTLAKMLIDARVGGGAHEDSLRSERIAEGLLYEAKYKPRAVLVGIGTAAPEERYTQAEVANLLGVDDPRMRAIYSSAHIESRRLAEIGAEQRAGGVTQGGLLAKHLRWSKKLAASAIPQACEAAGVALDQVGFLVVCTTDCT